MIYIARDKLSGADVEPMLRHSREFDFATPRKRRDFIEPWTMSNAIITIDLPSVYDQRAVARAAAEEVANLIGDQVKPWRISVSEAATESGWLVEVEGAGKKWAMVFDADDQNVGAIGAQFKLNLQPYAVSRNQ